MSNYVDDPIGAGLAPSPNTKAGSRALAASTSLTTASITGTVAAPGAAPRDAGRGGDERPPWTDLDYWLRELLEVWEEWPEDGAAAVACTWVRAAGGHADWCGNRVSLPPDLPSCPAAYALKA